MVDFSTPILVVDDDLHMRRTVRSMLRHIGFSEITEDDGKDTMEVMRNGRFGLVLSDLMMQPTSGLELLKRMRADARFASTPFIMVTGAGHAQAVRAALALGVDAYIVKPFNTSTLQRKVAGVLELAGTTTDRGRVPRVVEPPQSDERKLAELNDRIAALLALLQERAGKGDVSPQEDLVTVIRGYLDSAVELGIDEDYRAQFEAMLDDLPGRGLNQTPNINGIVLRPLAEKTVLPAADRREQAGATEFERRTGREARRHLRYAAPVLHVTIGGRAYRTVDWSIGGLCLAGFSDETLPDTQLSITLKIAGIVDHEAIFGDRCIVMRHDTMTGRLATCFKSCLSPTLKILEYLTRHHMRPTEAVLDAAS